MVKAEVDQAIHKYYAKIGWDEHGIPTRGTLEKLGVEWVQDVTQPTAETTASKRELVLA